MEIARRVCHIALRLLRLETGHCRSVFLWSRMGGGGRQQRFPTFAESCLWICEAVRANGGLRVSLRTHTIGQKRSSTGVGQTPWKRRITGLPCVDEGIRQWIGGRSLAALRVASSWCRLV